MITNERQYKITKSQLNFLQKAVDSYNLEKKTQQIGSDILATAELEALKSEIDVLQNQLYEYEALKTGSNFVLKASNLAELPRILIQARIAQNLSQKDLATLLSIKEQQIQRYEAEEYHSASLKRLLEIAEALNLNVSGIAEIKKDQSQTDHSSKDFIDWTKFPIMEMYKRGWFEDFYGSINEALSAQIDLLQEYIGQVYKKPALGFHRKQVRSNANIDEYALLAWECRVLHLANKVNTVEYKKELITPEWISQLVKLSKEPDGPRKVQGVLEHVGITLVIEPMLPNTFLDGAAFLHGDTPVIGLTLRYDRIDNFWFVLMHEIYHVINHLGKEKTDRIFDDLDIPNTNKFEREADELAAESLIPIDKWNKAIARFTRTPKSVNDFANILGINPAIIAGRIRFEEKNYRILNELVGQGEVRKQFPDITFGI